MKTWSICSLLCASCWSPAQIERRLCTWAGGGGIESMCRVDGAMDCMYFIIIIYSDTHIRVVR